MTLTALVLALVAACLFSAAVRLQHGSVRATGAARDGLSFRALSSVMRGRVWLGGTAFAVGGAALHLTALSLAPVAVVQPIGVLSLVLTVLAGKPGRASRIWAPVAMVCGGVGGFVLLSASTVVTATVPPFSAVQPAMLVGGALAAGAWCVRGRVRCLALASATAVLFGLGAATMRVAALNLFYANPAMGLALAAEAAVLLLSGGWLLHQAYAAGPAAVTVAATTVLDPFTAIATSAVVFGERPAASLTVLAFQAGSALAAVTGVLLLARSIPDQHPVKERPMPVPRHSTGLRVLIGADTFPPDVNGAARFTGRLARGLAGRGHDIHVLTPRPRGVQPQDEPFTVHHAVSHRTPFHPTFRFCTPRAARRAAGAFLDRLRPDVVHVQSHFSIGRGLLAAARERGIPAIATNHFMPENLLGYVGLPRPVASALARWAWRDFVRVFRHADVVTTPTPRAARLLGDHGLTTPATVVSCGIDLAHFAPGERVVARDEVHVLFVGRLDAEKNVDQLIQALRYAPGVRAEIVGDGSCRPRLQDLARKLGVDDRVTFHGVVSDASLVRAYHHNQVFCMPGTAELQSIATMEAMAAGLPVVAADAMALPHLVYSGLNGYLFQPGDIDALATHLITLAADPEQRIRMGQASRAVVARHSLDRTLDTYEDLYRTTAGATTALAVPA